MVGAPYYALREEIKALQNLAKVLTLSSSVFSRTRLLLSECWDKVRVLEKEHKKGVQDRRQASSEVRQHFQAKIEELKAQSEGMTLVELDREIDEISREMRAVTLDREDVRNLRDALTSVRIPHLDAQEKKAKDLEEAEREKIRLKKEKVSAVKEQVAYLLKEAHQMDIDALSTQFDTLKQEMGQLDISKLEKQQLERQIRTLKDLVADRKENSLLNLSDDDRKALENLRLVLQQKKERRQAIKENLKT